MARRLQNCIRNALDRYPCGLVVLQSKLSLPHQFVRLLVLDVKVKLRRKPALDYVPGVVHYLIQRLCPGADLIGQQLLGKPIQPGDSTVPRWLERLLWIDSVIKPSFLATFLQLLTFNDTKSKHQLILERCVSLLSLV